MNDLVRPNPDVLLAKIQSEESQNRKGKLKIFLGYAAGVGKTYAMLEAAQQRKDQKIDVVIGFIETHGRRDTEAKLTGLEIIPRKQMTYHGAAFTEMDIDAILKRNPSLVIVDELAHTNIPGSRHPRRYNDVEEFLAAGIDVYTTVNIQHFESMVDIVHQITGITVRETVPDRLLDEASEIEVIDLPPDELIQRLQDGKVYIPDQAIRAIEKFFRKGNLTALREISLRRAAERVDTQMRSYMRDESIAGPWPAADRILVCISSHPLGERLIRAGRKLSDDLDAQWIVAFVETPGHTHMPSENQERIVRNLSLAEQLGAHIEYLSGTTVAQAVLDFARKNNITKIIAGKPLRPRWFELLRGGSVVDQIIRESGTIDIYVISETQSQPISLPPTSRFFHRRWDRYFRSLLLVGLVSIINAFFFEDLEPTNLVMFYLAAVVVSALYLGRGPSILASMVSVLVFDFFFIHPKYSFAVADTEYILTFAGLLGVGLIISSSASQLRDQLDQLRKRETNARALNSLSKELTAAVDLDDVLNVVVKNLGQLFECNVAILLPKDSALVIRKTTKDYSLDKNDMAVAEWAFLNRQAAGEGTETLPASMLQCLPLLTSHGIVGVMGIKSSSKDRLSRINDRLLLENYTNLAALAIERAVFAEQASQAESLRTTERLQSALLNSISHELRTPLSSIMGVLSSLEEDESEKGGETRLDHDTRLELIHSAATQTRQLNQLVGNLLDMTRIQAGSVKLNCSMVDMQDLIGAVLNQMENRLDGRQVDVVIPDDFPSVNIDSVLIGQALVNLLDNALKFSPPGSGIKILTELRKKEFRICVDDSGPGVPPAEIDKIFEKFYRGSKIGASSGSGLGLSICRGIVEAHNGKIWAENRKEGGLRIVISIPLQVTDSQE
ncbi:MAG: sensor histidine kinase KdpD [Leptolinea sp.]|jgi:two-component system sensor histidine kinase KdpD|nr:sensor histidine kinase KdpD [Leptolinea sp.]